MISRTAKILIAVLVTLGGGFYAYLGIRDPGGFELPAEELHPPGRWRVAPTFPATDDPDLDRVLSLPYLQGKVEAGQTTGVVRHDLAAAHNGLNLYCSAHSPEAVLMDMEGSVLHRWRLPFEEAFPEQTPDLGSLYFRRVQLLPDGHLLALFQGWGLVRLDRRSKIVWTVPLPAFNDFFVTREDHILVLHKRSTIVPDIDPARPVLEDFVVELASDGTELRRWSLLDLFRTSDYSDLLSSMGPGADLLHSNTVTLLEHSPFDDGIFPAHGLLVSLREVDTIGVLDAEEGRVVWAARGGWRRQHEPVLLPSGRILLFDNLGRPDETARVIEIEPTSGEVVWSWGERPGERLFSPEGGSVARLPNGNTLITESESGRALEVTADGKIVWEFRSPHRAGPRNALVAALWEVVRLDPSAARWLDSPGS